MANFDRSGMTQTGINLMGKAVAGATIQFTKLVLGDGTMTGEILNLQGVVSPKKNVDITRIERNDNQCTVGGELLTSSIVQGFYWREIGLYARDTDGAEVLYCYASSSKPDYLVDKDAGVIQELIVEMVAAVGTGTKVEANINDSMVFSRIKVNGKDMRSVDVVAADGEVKELSLNNINYKFPKGDKGDTGATGPQGPRGDVGSGLKIKGSVSSTENLPSTKEIGDGYFVGMDLYIWDGNEWANKGPITSATSMSMNGVVQPNVNLTTNDSEDAITMMNGKHIFSEIQGIQIEKLNGKFVSNNLLNECEPITDRACEQTGYEHDASGYSLFKHIKVSANTTYNIYPRARYVVLYNNEKTLLSSSGTATTDADLSFTPLEDGYVSITVYSDVINDCKVYTTDYIDDVAGYGKSILDSNVTIKDNGVPEITNKIIKETVRTTSNLLTEAEFHANKYYDNYLEERENSNYSYFKVKITEGEEYNLSPRARFLILTDKNKNKASNSYDEELFDSTTFIASSDGYAYITVYNVDLPNVFLWKTGETNLLPIGQYLLNENITVPQDTQIINKVISETVRMTSNLLTGGEFHVNKYFDTYLREIDSSNYSYFKVKITKGVEYNLSPRARFLILTDTKNNKASNSYSDELFENTTFTAETDGYAYITVYNVDLPNVFCYVTGETNLQPVGKYLLNKNINVELETTDSNILRGKKWVSCGDSFTAGGYGSSDNIDETVYKYQDGLYKGKQITYPYIIGLRNGMNIVNEAVSGSTMAVNSGAGAGSFATSRYKNIPSDADYITLYFGINDDNYSSTLGTIDDTDTTTFYGAWNTVLEHLITNHPYAKIGIIVTNGSNPKYTEATRNIAKKWGIPYLDLEMDYNVPLMHRVTERPELCDKAKQLRLQAFRISSTNTHPNVKAHEYQSTFIENFLRSL